ncbi:MAG: 30S ribosomal protein S12 methylthiotransferase RimO [Bacteroidales bacterium]|nr:30S ribosomal protein S12 methylthiotransferase RimO [Bacteroidales bacterium]
MKVNIITLGCSKNTVDSENLAGALSAAGAEVFFDRQRNDCDVVIVNTCGFIGDAKEESVNTILQQVGVKQRGRKKRLLIAVGCLVERYKAELQKELPDVDAWFGVHEWKEIAEYVRGQRSEVRGRLKRLQSTPSHYAYLKISEGCNRSCSYCAIPLIRGRHISRPMEEIVAEAKGLVKSGVKELLVIAQDTTFYGLDLYGERRLAQLLDRLATESGAEWIRLHYTYPASFPIEVLDVMARHDNICKYLDIPLQHINTRILASMQRNIDREATLRLIETIRQKMPDITLRTTLIVGYPGETEEMFEELKSFVAEAKFDRLGAFTYSQEEGTPAEKLGDPLNDEEKQRRLAEIMELQDAISYEKNQAIVGKIVRVLVDRREGEYYIGRTEADSPEVDDEVIIKVGKKTVPLIGDFCKVRITQAFEHDVMAEIE